MFRTLTSIPAKLDNSKFIAVTAENSESAQALIPEDQSNITEDDRDLGLYNYWLRLEQPLEEIILELAKLNGRAIDILDSGCGQGVAMDELLSNPQLKDAINSCTGISMNYFTNIGKIIERHGNRFRYFYGKVQDVLEQTQPKFDLIIDMAGAHCYSVDKVYVLRLYHQALRPNGKAEIFHQANYIHFENKPIVFYSNIARNFPTTFFDRPNRSLTISKSTRNFPLPELKVAVFEEALSATGVDSIDTARSGNGIFPKHIDYELDDHCEQGWRIL